VAGVSPSGNLTWFQAQIACANARKRLPSSAEWQAAVTGTPDPGADNGTTDCNSTGGVSLTGARSACVSSAGAFDMVGNLYELVADWVPKAFGCDTWNAGLSPTDDQQCFTAQGEPFAVMRGGFSGFGQLAGPLAINSLATSTSLSAVGFRCTR
jgi:formylglycine-generating enzyme required for sulfatase activity